jgi:putative DNA primase/helicase
MTIILPTRAAIARLVNFPARERQRVIWLVWCNETRKGRVTKVPYCARTGQLAKSNDSSTWSTHGQAVKAWKHGRNWKGKRYDGVGIGLAELVGVDLDGCVLPDGTLEDWAQEMIDELGSYTEWSPNHGVHIIVAGEWPFRERQKNLVPGREHYGPAFYGAGSARYFTVTGNAIGDNRTIAERTRELAVIHHRLWPEAEAKPKSRPKRDGPAGPAWVPQPLNIPDKELLQRAKNARDGGEFCLLWEGIWEGRYPSHSEADFHLCRRLAFWTGKDAERIRRLFLRSDLVREDKCIERTDYLERTIQKAIAATTETYQPLPRDWQESAEWQQKPEWRRKAEWRQVADWRRHG